MSGSHGGLLGVGELGGLEREIDPMINLDEDTSVKRRTIKLKEAISERKFRRQSHEDVVAEEIIVVGSNSRDFNLLMLIGGSGGKYRSKYPKTKEGNHFPCANKHVSTFNKLLPICER